MGTMLEFMTGISPHRVGDRYRMVAARAVAVAAALFWGVLFFGIIDLTVVLAQDTRFYEHYLLETGWGLLYTVLVMLPLVVWAVRPTWHVLSQQVMVAALAVLLTGVAALSPGQVVVALSLGASALVPPLLAHRRPPWPRGGVHLRGARPLPLGLVLVGTVAAAVYAARMIDAAWDGRPDDETWGLMHLPMQAAFGLAVAGSAVVAVIAMTSRDRSWWPALLPPSVSAVWIGAVSSAYPSHLGSLGRLGGIAAMVWGLAFAALVVITSGRRAAG